LSGGGAESLSYAVVVEGTCKVLALSITAIPSSGREEGAMRVGTGTSCMDWLETEVAELRVFNIGLDILERFEEEAEGLTRDDLVVGLGSSTASSNSINLYSPVSGSAIGPD
jgi:hypothetical protein